MSVATRADLDALGSSSLAEVMRFVPGVNIDRDPATGGSAVKVAVLTASTFAWGATSERFAPPTGALPHLRAAVPETPPPRSASC